MIRRSRPHRASLQVVRLPDAVAVVATGSFWRAKQAVAKLQPKWDVGDDGTTDSAQFSREYHAALDGPAEVARNNGYVDEALPRIISQTQLYSDKLRLFQQCPRNYAQLAGRFRNHLKRPSDFYFGHKNVIRSERNHTII